MKPIMKRINDEWCSYISSIYKTLIELYKEKCNDYDEYKNLYFILLESTSITEELFNELLDKLAYMDIVRLRWRQILTKSIISHDKKFVENILSRLNLSENTLQYVFEYDGELDDQEIVVSVPYNNECCLLNNKLLSGELNEEDFIKMYENKDDMTNKLVKYCIKHTNGYTSFCNVNMKVQEETFLNFDFIVKHNMEIAPIFMTFFKMTNQQIDKYVTLNNLEFLCHNVNVPLRKIVDVYKKYECFLDRGQKLFYKRAMLLYRKDFTLDILVELVKEHINTINDTNDQEVIADNLYLIKYEMERHIMDESYYKFEYNKFYEKYAKEHLAAFKIQNCMRSCFENPYNPIGYRHIMKQFEKIYHENNYILC
jgi:hypothetical protein